MKSNSRVLAVAAALSLIISACGDDSSATSTSTTGGASTTAVVDTRTPVIFDYSPTVSDVGALLFLATHRDLRLIAVTLPGTGESHCEPGVAHTRGVLEALGLGDIPVACGSDKGFGAMNPFPPDWRVRSDVIDLPQATPNESRVASELISDLVQQSSVPVVVVAVGPLTNLATAISDHPEIARGIAGITIMGGAVHVAGNVPPVPGWEHVNPYAEVNFWVDPTAAAEVVASGIPITLVPLDATNFVPVDGVFHAALVSEPQTAASGLLSQVWAQAPEWVSDGYFLWDELAAAVLADPTIVEFETLTLLVEPGDSVNAGWSREDPTGMQVRVAISADRTAFEELFLGTLLGRQVDIGRPVASAAQVSYFDAIAVVSNTFETAFEVEFDAAATELGLGEELSDEDWFETVRLAAPRIVDGPMVVFSLALAAVTAPPELSELHTTWLVALDKLLSNRDQFVESFETSDPFATENYAFERLAEVETACIAIQDAGAALGVMVDFNC